MAYPLDRFTRAELYSVQKPGRYIGREWGGVLKERWEVSWLSVYPDLYEVGISYFGLNIFHFMLNEIPWVFADYSFVPAPDMAHLMRNKGVKMWGYQSGMEAGRFDVLAFHILTEMNFTNVLYFLDLAGIPLLAKDRDFPDYPLVVAGGPAITNPEPMASFLDVVFVGDGELTAPKLLEVLRKAKLEGWNKSRLLDAILAEIPGAYVPSVYSFEYEGDRLVRIDGPRVKAVRVPRKEIYVPKRMLVPNVEGVQERATVEVFRGCTRGCRYCHAGQYYRPVREQPPDLVTDVLFEIVRNTGFVEAGLLSLSTMDYSAIRQLVEMVLAGSEEFYVRFTLPSLRVESLFEDVLDRLDPRRSLTFTIAPEVGSDRLRRVINKGFANSHVIAAIRRLAEMGWNKFKFYFMVGLPTETEEDVRAIGELLLTVDDVLREAGHRRRMISATIGHFVPKPHTPFQWARQLSMEEYAEKLRVVRRIIKKRRSVKVRSHPSYQSTVEGVLSRGDRRLSEILLKAYARGAKLDAWDDYFAEDVWQELLRSVESRYLAPREEDEVFPWDAITVGMKKQLLLVDWKRAIRGELLRDCRLGCYGCGVCDFRRIKNELIFEGRLPVIDDG